MSGTDPQKFAAEFLKDNKLTVDEAAVNGLLTSLWAKQAASEAYAAASEASKTASWGKFGGIAGGLGSVFLLGKSMFVERPAMKALAQNLEAQATKTNVIFGGLVVALVASALPLLKNQRRNIAPRHLSQTRIQPQKHPQQILPPLTPPQQIQALPTYPAPSSSILKV